MVDVEPLDGLEGLLAVLELDGVVAGVGIFGRLAGVLVAATGGVEGDLLELFGWLFLFICIGLLLLNIFLLLFSI